MSSSAFFDEILDFHSLVLLVGMKGLEPKNSLWLFEFSMLGRAKKLALKRVPQATPDIIIGSRAQ